MTGGRVFAVLLLVVGIAGSLVSDSPVYTRLFYLGVLIVLVSLLWARLSLRKLRVKREARSLRASVGDVFDEHFEVINAGRLSCLWVEVRNQSSIPTAAGSRLLTRIGGRQVRTYIARTWLTRRGAFELGPTELVSGDPFGLFHSRKVFPSGDTLVVVPMIVDLDRFISPPGLLPGGRVIRRRALDVTPHASGVREYVQGDPLKRIHWPTSVRRQQLMVKEFDQDPQAEVWLFLDAQAGVHSEQTYEPPVQEMQGFLFAKKPDFHLPPSTLEYSISIAASLAHYFIQQKRAVGYVSAGQVQTVIPAERSLRQEDKILDVLAFLTDRGQMPLGSLAMAQASQVAPGSSVVLITPSVNPEILLAADGLQRRNLRPVVILLMSETFGGPPGSEKQLELLTERNIPVCPIYNGTDLAQALSNFASQARLQEVNPWLVSQFIPST
jgi:uncharacterized protein (DUF58 family)